MRGQFSDDSLYLPIEVHGISESNKRPFNGLIDTGFSGYLTLPLLDAFPLGLVLKGQQSHTLADGSIAHHFICLGTVTFEGKSVIIPIDVQQGGPVLIGIQLLRKLDHDLHISFANETFEFIPSVKKRKGLRDVKVNV